MGIFNVIIIITLINLATSIFFKNRITGLFCGIFVFNGDDPTKFNKDKFSILGLYNDSRGGDAVGIYFDGEEHKSVNPSDYKDFGIDLKFDKPEYPLVIGHTRKGSAGMGKTLSQAQPIVIENNDLVEMVLVHNGTIYNEDELATKYSILGSNLTDTQILTQIIHKHGYKKVLTEYRGSAALVWFNYEDSSLYVYHGKSNQYSYGYGNATEERPLYWLKENNTMYISSMESSLKMIAKDNSKVECVPHNIVYRIKNGKIYSHVKIHRDNATQSKIAPSKPVHTQHAQQTSIPYRHSDSNILNLDHKYDKGFLSYMLVYNKGSYYMQDDLAHGTFLVNSTGLLLKDAVGNLPSYELEFYDGIPIIPGTFEILDKVVSNSSLKEEREYAKILDDFALINYTIPYNNEARVHPKPGWFRQSRFDLLKSDLSSVQNINNDHFKLCSETVNPFFSKYSYKFHAGDLTNFYELSGITKITSSLLDKAVEYKKLLLSKYYDYVVIPDIDNIDNDDDTEVINANITCPKCLGNDQGENCDLCSNTGLISQDDYDEYVEIIANKLNKEARELSLTDLSLEDILIVQNSNHRSKFLIEYLEDYASELLELMTITNNTELMDIIDSVEDFVEILKSWQLTKHNILINKN